MEPSELQIKLRMREHELVDALLDRDQWKRYANWLEARLESLTGERLAGRPENEWKWTDSEESNG